MTATLLGNISQMTLFTAMKHHDDAAGYCEKAAGHGRHELLTPSMRHGMSASHWR
jgi:hypothetical protein